MAERVAYAMNKDLLKDYRRQFLDGIVSRDEIKDYFIIPQIAKLLGCTHDMVKRQILWVFNVPSHMVGNTKIIRKKDLRNFLRSPNGEVWVRERFCMGKITQETLNGINRFKETGRC